MVVRGDFAAKNGPNDDHLTDEVKMRRWRLYMATQRGQVQVLEEMGVVAL